MGNLDIGSFINTLNYPNSYYVMTIMKILYIGDSTSIHDFRFVRKLVENGYDTNVLTID